MSDKINEHLALQSRKLKLNKKFKPLTIEIGEELRQNGIFEFNISKLLKYIKENPTLFQKEEVSVKAVRTLVSKNLDESTIQTANTNEPIVLAEIAPEQFNVIDGNHRLERAYRDSLTTIFAYRVSAEQHVVFLTFIDAHRNYIAYWNSKLKES